MSKPKKPSNKSKKNPRHESNRALSSQVELEKKSAPTDQASATAALRAAALGSNATAALRTAALRSNAAAAAYKYKQYSSSGNKMKVSPIKIESALDVGLEVRRVRKKMGMTQQKFADLAGVGRRFISELESGKPTLEFNRVIKVCRAAGIDISIHSRESKS